MKKIEETEGTLTEIATFLASSDKKVQLIYAFNGTGKTRLSTEFKKITSVCSDQQLEENISDQFKEILYFNAFTEDLFYWKPQVEFLSSDSDSPTLSIWPNSFTSILLKTLNDLSKDSLIQQKFQEYTNTRISPIIENQGNGITFQYEHLQNGPIAIKISKGEESCFKWSLFYALLEGLVETLGFNPENRGVTVFDKIKYVFIDDPVSSLDDPHLMHLAVDLAKLIKKSFFTKNGSHTNNDSVPVKFIITTHNPLFFNALSNELTAEWEEEEHENLELEGKLRKSIKYKKEQMCKYHLKRPSNTNFILSTTGDSPFAYHLFLLNELLTVIKSNTIKKYHLNHLRNILEKTANFLGHKNWSALLAKGPQTELACRLINSGSHSAHSGEEWVECTDVEKRFLEKAIKYLLDTNNFNASL